MQFGIFQSFSRSFRAIRLAYLISVFFSGCASSTTKGSVRLINNMDVAYGRVIKIYPLERIDSDLCANKGSENARSAAICANRDAYEKARIAFMHVDTRLIEGTVAVPKSDAVKEKYILEIKPTLGIGSYQRIAARTETDACRWDGPTPEFLNGGTGIVTGFVAGMLIVPGVIMLSTDALLGGVECEGWSYKAVVEQARKH